MSNQMVMVSRELLKRLYVYADMPADEFGEIRALLKEPPAAQSVDGTDLEAAVRVLKYFNCPELAQAVDRARTALSAPVQSEQVPVAVLYKDGQVLTKADCGDVFDICCKVETPLYAAPVREVMLPEAKTRQEVINNTHYSQGWNDCIAETVRLNTPQ